MSITEDMMGASGDERLATLAAEPFEKGSAAALWMLLLLRLKSVATDQRLELRNSEWPAHGCPKSKLWLT
jgi:hypothetical protein